LFSPPCRAEPRLSRRKWLLGRSGPWQRKQLASKMGLMSRWKSIVMFVGGGSFEVSIEAPGELPQQSRIAARATGRSTLVLVTSPNHARRTTESRGNQSGRGQPQSKTLSRSTGWSSSRQVLDCGCPLPLFWPNWDDHVPDERSETPDTERGRFLLKHFILIKTAFADGRSSRARPYDSRRSSKCPGATARHEANCQ